MALTLIANLDPGLQCRNTLNAVIDLVGANHPWTSGSIPYTNSSNDYAQDNTNFFWDAAGKLLTAGNGLKIKGTTSGTVTLNTKAAAGTWALTLPDSAGTSGYALTTDGAGVTSWTAAGAGGGTTILSGSGAPSTGLGSLGDYYVDEDGNQLYGPKEFITPIGPDQIAIPPAMTPGTTNNAVVALGGHITIAVNGEITALRYYRSASSSTAHTVSLWTTGGSLLASASVANDGGGTGWIEVALTTPYAVTAGTTVVVSTEYTGDFVRTNSASFPISNGGDLTLIGSSWGPSGFPPNADTANFFLDLVFKAVLPATLNWPMAVDGDAVAIGATVGSATAGSVLFAGTAGALAQNNANFFWDNVNHHLKITGSYYIGAVPGLFTVIAAGGANWFEGNSGNYTLTGYGNFGTGDGVMASMTTGSGNMGIGGTSTRPSAVPTMNYMTTGSDNVAVGPSALSQNTTGTFNVALGTSAMIYGTINGGCVAIGANSLLQVGIFGTADYGNVAIGYGTLGGLTGGSNNCAVGTGAGSSLYSANHNTFIGDAAGSQLQGDFNTVLGSWVGSYSSPAMSDVIALSNGRGWLMADYNRMSPYVWSFPVPNAAFGASGLHVYNVQDTTDTPPTNYERAGLDWRTTANVFRLFSQAGGTGTARIIAIDGFAKAGAPAAGDLPSGSFAVIDDTSGGATWLVFNKAGTIRKVQLT